MTIQLNHYHVIMICIRRIKNKGSIYMAKFWGIDKYSTSHNKIFVHILLYKIYYLLCHYFIPLLSNNHKSIIIFFTKHSCFT